MEHFRLRVRHEARRGHIWELHLFPEYPRRQLREAEGLRPAPTQSRQGPDGPAPTQWRQGRVLGSCATPEATLWLRQIAEPFLLRAEAPGPIAAEQFGPAAAPRWLRPEDGMRLALAFSAARWLVTPRQRRLFREGLEELPSEVVLYWFTLCFYGYRQAAGRAALRTLFTHEEPEETGEGRPSANRRRKRQPESGPNLFSLSNGEGPEGPAPSQTRQQRPEVHNVLIRGRSDTDYKCIGSVQEGEEYNHEHPTN
jgi:hypothetical protein